MNWEAFKDRWPNVAFSKFVKSGPHAWHVQQMGSGPELVLIHGAGGSTHTWRDVAPLFAEKFHVTAIDLPGQGFTELGDRNRCGLEPMSADLRDLFGVLGVTPNAIIGHSAGAAIALRMAIDWPAMNDTKLICINGALGNFRGLAGVLFPVLAKILSLNPFIPAIFSRTAENPQRAERLIASTGSQIDDAGMEQYRALISDRDHVDATLAMMAQWSLDRLLAELPKISQEVLFIAGSNDKAVPPDTSDRAAARIPNAAVMHLNGRGHLLHEEAPDKFTDAAFAFLDQENMLTR
ncbi:MAG: alpha/beta fold hydrolase [Litoreibacter sp.]|nr:alpha/beta fold hydrolase [Litoreibacter sp.]